MRPVAGVAVVVVLVVAACGGGDDAEPVPTDVAVGTTSPPSTAPTTTEPTPVTTEPATPTTVDETAALIADIEADLNAGEQALFAAGADPANPELRAELERHFVDAGLARSLAFLDELTAEGFVTRPNSDVQSSIEVLRVLSADSGVAEVEICRIDAGVVVQALPGGGEVIVNDDIIRYDTRVVLQLVGGVWRSPGNGESLAESAGVASCE